jgi:NO-binding membrane sensor protein with MHYT domain
MKKQTRGSTRSKLDTADASVELARHDPRVRSAGGSHEAHQRGVLHGGGVCGMHYLGVKSVKMLSSSCM